ncbi:MAG: MFS transporter [Candidatus Levybacteria bacterium]|nr:MFS transporter [Candidatus Levybacteria bacterium]
MSLLPSIDHVTGKATFSHFLLMFGYKLFSLYFPLFLLSKGLAFHQIGYSYLLIYLPIVFFAPIVGFLNYKFKPVFLIVLGIIGYAIYSLGMIYMSSSSSVFYFMQVLLGISAALFFVSHKGILIGARFEKPARSFGWFYSAPYYASEFAPLIGAVLIWRFGFTGVFAASFIIHILNIVLSFFFFRTNSILFHSAINLNYSIKEFLNLSKLIFGKNTLPFIATSLAVLLVGGFYQAFFVIFLKSIGWSQNTILIFAATLSAIFVPISIYGISFVSKIGSNVFKGSLIFAIGSILFGIFGSGIGFMGILILMEMMELGGFITNTIRSGILSKTFAKDSSETAAIDTIFSPLGTAMGAMLGGLLIGILGFPLLFGLGGIIVLLVSFWAKILFSKQETSL